MQAEVVLERRLRPSQSATQYFRAFPLAFIGFVLTRWRPSQFWGQVFNSLVKNGLSLVLLRMAG